jgi:hypothetical protein
MRDVTDRLPRVKAADRQRAFAAVGEAVWWVTIIDGTLVRHHPEAYDCVMAAQAPAERLLIEGTLSGLRFVRNQMGQYADHVDFIAPGADGGRSGERRITGEIFGRSAAFLKLAAARATAPAETLAAPGQLSETSRSASDGR